MIREDIVDLWNPIIIAILLWLVQKALLFLGRVLSKKLPLLIQWGRNHATAIIACLLTLTAVNSTIILVMLVLR
jgi:hypothetical protein